MVQRSTCNDDYRDDDDIFPSCMSFRDQLVTTRDRKHSKDHLFFQLWAQGKLTKKQTAIYCAQHYHYVTEYLNWMAYEASQIPLRDVKAYLFENLGDEENPEDRHLDMLKITYRRLVPAAKASRIRWSSPQPRACRTGAGGWSIKHHGKQLWRACSSAWSRSSWISVKKLFPRCTNTMASRRATGGSAFSRNMYARTKSTAREVSRSVRSIAILPSY